MSALDETGNDYRPPGVTPGEAAIVAAVKDLKSDVKAELRGVKAEVVSLREKAPSPKLLVGGAIGAVMLVFGIQAATTVYLISGLLQTRGVDVTLAAEATRAVVKAGTDAGTATTTTTTTETTTPTPAAVEPAAP